MSSMDSRACRSVEVGKALVGVSIFYVYAVCEGETDKLGIRAGSGHSYGFSALKVLGLRFTTV